MEVRALFKPIAQSENVFLLSKHDQLEYEANIYLKSFGFSVQLRQDLCLNMPLALTRIK